MMSDQIDIDVQSDPAGSDQRDVSDDIVEVPNLHSLGSVDEDQGDSSLPEMARQIILELFFGERREMEDGNHIKERRTCL